MTRGTNKLLVVAAFAAAVGVAPGRAEALVVGSTGPNFNLYAASGYISTPDGGSYLMWGYGEGGTMQYPGTTMIVTAGQTVTVTLTNLLNVPTSMVFPGQTGVTATPVSGTTQNGLMTLEAAPGAVVRYSFVATKPGTYMYHSGTQADLQIEMGMVGALIVRPASPNQAYAHVATGYDHETLFLLTEMDPAIHLQVELGLGAAVDTNSFNPTLWFINGRAGPDTLFPNGVPWLPTQPYNCLPRIHPGETMLLRVVAAGRDQHPFHTHGNNFLTIARDGRLLESTPGAGPDLGWSDYTLGVVPGATYDMLFTWTGEGLGWDIYGHAPGDPMEQNEYAPDHGKAFPVTLPNALDLTFGGYYSGSPYLGSLGALPPGEGGLNPSGGLFYMWHSHTEKELTNNNIYPGGMLTMLIVEPFGVVIP